MPGGVKGAAQRLRRFRPTRAPALTIGVLALYVVVSLLFFAGPLWRAPGTVALASGKYPDDASLFMWMLAWWPHAIAHGLDPLLTRQLFAPDGFNLAWTTSFPGPSVLAAPVTLTAGPVVAYNAIALLSPALDAFTAFLLCRHVTGRMWPSVVGGYLFGFSSYTLGTLAGGHLHLSLVTLVPLCVLLVVRHLDRSIGSRSFVFALAFALVGQFLISTEVLLTMTLFGGAALVLALASRRRRSDVLRAVLRVGVAYAAMAVVVSPLLYYMLARPATTPHVSPTVYAANLANFVFPTDLTALGHGTFASIARTFNANPSERGAYLGIPLLAIVALFAIRRRKRAGEWILLASFALAAVMSLGPRLHVGASLAGFSMPWTPFTHLPLVRYALPSRFTAFAFLAAGLMTAVWLSRTPRAWRWLLAVAAIVVLLPNRGGRLFHESYSPPRFITHGAFKSRLTSRDRVLVIPFRGGHAMRWQAQARMRFALVGGYAQRLPASYARRPIVASLESNVVGPGDGPGLARFLAAKRVTVVLVDARHRGPWPRLLAGIHLAAVPVAGVLMYRVRGARKPLS